MQRLCSHCRQLKPVSEFRRGWMCNDCRQVSKQKRSEYLKEWRKAKGAQSSADWRERNPDYDRERYAANRERSLAMTTAAKAVREGRLPPASSLRCTQCGEPAAVYWHESLAREDRLKVKPVCKKCNRELRNASQIETAGHP